jgi:hypothetical protein
LILLEKRLKEYIPENKLILPKDILIPNFGDQYIKEGTEVRYDAFELGDIFLLVIYYEKIARPVVYVKVPLLFDSKDDAIKQGFIV